jgi:hypothetical protein
MAETGYLDGKDMAMSFRMLRPNSLIWHYVVHGWLYGEKPSAFDVLYWNMDTTRMPAAMHSWYLRQFYQHNNLIKPNALTWPAIPSIWRTSASRCMPLPPRMTISHRGSNPSGSISVWRQAFRAVHLRPHPGYRQPAGQSAQARLLGGPASATKARNTGTSGRTSSGQLVG